MRRVAAALVGVADAEDGVQEALRRAWKGWHRLEQHLQAISHRDPVARFSSPGLERGDPSKPGHPLIEEIACFKDG